MDSTAHTLELPGLREDQARDFLAAIGLLRLLDVKWPQLEPKLTWNHAHGSPRIMTAMPLYDDWCTQLVSDIQSLEGHTESPLFHGEIIKADAKLLRGALIKAIRFASTTHPLAKLPELIFAGYCTQEPDTKTGLVEPTLLSFANGQSGKSLLRDVRELIRLLDPEDMRAALLGNGIPVVGKAFRWMPQEYRPAAHRAHDPGSKVRGDEPLDYPPLNVLAFFGLSCIPMTPDIDGETTAFFRNDTGWEFRWPIWMHPSTIKEVIALITLPNEILTQIPDVIHIWKSRRLVAEKSIYFSPATLA